MVVFLLKLVSVFSRNIQQPRWLNLMIRNTHFKSPSLEPRSHEKIVAVFWDLDNKPPNPIPPYEAALKLKNTAFSFGFVRHMIAYANPKSLSLVPREIRDLRNERRALSKLENKGLVRPVEAYRCGVCGRNFYNHDKFVNHFKTIHERENAKRLSQIESARGSRRVNLVGKYSMKMEKYKRASRDILAPKLGYSLEDELERAGFRVMKVGDEPQAVDVAMKSHIVGLMNRRKVECLVIVSDDSDFAEVVEEAKMRRVRTVVVGNAKDGALKRVADRVFLWREVMTGKAKKEAVSVLGKWKDRRVLERLEWSYDPAVEKSLRRDDGDESDGGGLMMEDESRAWWEIQSDGDHNSSR